MAEVQDVPLPALVSRSDDLGLSFCRYGVGADQALNRFEYPCHLVWQELALVGSGLAASQTVLCTIAETVDQYQAPTYLVPGSLHSDNASITRGREYRADKAIAGIRSATDVHGKYMIEKRWRFLRELELQSEARAEIHFGRHLVMQFPTALLRRRRSRSGHATRKVDNSESRTLL